MDKAEIDGRIRKIAPLLKVDDILRERPINLSGGQKQRVNIARAIVREPKLLLLDEPLSHLDGKMRQGLRAEIKRLHRSINCTTIIVTHDQLEAMSLADRIAIMKDGMLQQYGTPLEVYDNPVNDFVAGFIGEPPMNLMVVTIKQAGNDFLFVFGDGKITIPVPQRYNAVVRDGMKVRLGVRPTDVKIGSVNSKGSDVSVSVFESLGEERRVHFRVGEEFLTLITIEKIHCRPGNVLKLEVLSEKTHLFDLKTGDKIRA